MAESSDHHSVHAENALHASDTALASHANKSCLKCTVSYDGSNFSGWQRQHNLRTVQGEIESALAKIANQPVPVQCAGRTDSGVHALGQVFSCTWPGPYPIRLRHALSQMLAPEIRVTSIEEVSPDFNARFSATGKHYWYSFEFSKEPTPFTAKYAWHVPYKVDLDLLNSLLPQFIGRHDFVGFESAGSQMKTTVRTLHSLQLYPGGFLTPPGQQNLYHLEFYGDAFLYKMVRNISGTLIEIARGRFSPDIITTFLQSKGPFKGHCAPAHGLVLIEVEYDGTRTMQGQQLKTI